MARKPKVPKGPLPDPAVMPKDEPILAYDPETGKPATTRLEQTVLDSENIPKPDKPSVAAEASSGAKPKGKVAAARGALGKLFWGAAAAKTLQELGQAGTQFVNAASPNKYDVPLWLDPTLDYQSDVGRQAAEGSLKEWQAGTAESQHQHPIGETDVYDEYYSVGEDLRGKNQGALGPAPRPGDVEDYLGRAQAFGKEGGLTTMLDDYAAGEVPVGKARENMNTVPVYLSREQSGVDPNRAALPGPVVENKPLADIVRDEQAPRVPMRDRRAALPTYEDMFTRYLQMAGRAGSGRNWATANIANNFAANMAGRQLESLYGNAKMEREDENDIYRQQKDEQAQKLLALQEQRLSQQGALDTDIRKQQLAMQQEKFAEEKRRNAAADEWVKQNWANLSPEEQLIAQSGGAAKLVEIRERAAEERKVQAAKIVQEAREKFGIESAAYQDAVDYAQAWLASGGAPLERHLDKAGQEAEDYTWQFWKKDLEKKDPKYIYRPTQRSALGPLAN